MWIRTYGRLYQKLCSTTCEIPIGIYRTQDTSSMDATHVSSSPLTDRWNPFGGPKPPKHCVRMRPSVSRASDSRGDRVSVRVSIRSYVLFPTNHTTTNHKPQEPLHPLSIRHCQPPNITRQSETTCITFTRTQTHPSSQFEKHTQTLRDCPQTMTMTATTTTTSEQITVW